jgi:hypothetical protein
MYATCLFCNKPLGDNETFETFPVGRRLAFDAAKGRLWVVCPHCERWNLTPLEERWEAIEKAEGLYRDTRRRVATDNIGLAKLRDGTTLVRIGQPMRPEFAAWRYGDQFGRRRRRQLLIAGGGVAALGTLVVGGAMAGVGIGGVGWGLMRVARMIVNGNPETVVAKIATDRGAVLHVRRRHLAETTLTRDPSGELAIQLRYKNGQGEFVGREAERIAAIVLPKVNRFGANRDGIASAVREIEYAGSAESYLGRLTQMSHIYTRPKAAERPWRMRRSAWRDNGDTSHGLFGLPAAHRLALEMALHEEAERRAFEGELAELERAWREAEEIAAIADDMFIPTSVTTTIEKLRES